MDSVSLAVPAACVACVELALVRLGYLYPDVSWSFDLPTRSLKAGYRSAAHSGETLAKEASFQLYREKIYSETLGIRGKIYEAI